MGISITAVIGIAIVMLFVGALATWLVMKSRIVLAEVNGKSAGESERAALLEKGKSLEQEVAFLKERLISEEQSYKAMQKDFEEISRKAAQYEERSSRIPELEDASKTYRESAEKAQQELSESRELSATLSAELAAKRERISELEADIEGANAARDVGNRQCLELSTKVAELTSSLDSEKERSKRDIALLSEAKEQLSNQFEVLENKILEDKSKKFADQNQVNLSQLLVPFQENIKTFQAKVEEVYVNEGKDRSALAEQVKMLTQLNSTLSQDTQNLVLTLKGDRRAQGNWGEIILDEVLERAGLLCDQHYTRQGHVKTEDGKSHVIPDVVVNLPGNRHLVIDSKMTLPDYRAYFSSENDAERDAALKRHFVSIRRHIKGLSEKNYQSLYGLKSLDFVIMFVPLEPAFALAVANDQELFQHAWEQNVLLVSPSTLLFVIRTVAYLWRQEDLSRNAQEISNRGAALYDRLAGFVTDLQKVGERIQQAQNSYGEAKRKLSEGAGNVIRQAEMLKSLGVKPTRAIPTELVSAACDTSGEEKQTPRGSSGENTGSAELEPDR